MVRLILEGGGMRGTYTAGVLDCFLDNNIEIDDIVGVSAGICTGINYVSKQKYRSLKINTKYLDHGRYVGIKNLLATGSIFNMELLFKRIPDELEPFDYKTYNNSGKRVVSVATSCRTGEAVYFDVSDLKRGSLEKIQASASIPLLARPVEIDGELYYDGGVSDSIPIEWSIKNGADWNIIILTRPSGYRKEEKEDSGITDKVLKKYPAIAKAYSKRTKVYNASLELCEKEAAAGRAIIIAPSDTEGVSRLTKDRVKLVRLYKRGYSDAEKMIGKIKEFI